jgi:dynein intermediate chain 1
MESRPKSFQKGPHELAEAELDREIPPRTLRPSDPRAVSNIARFSYKDRCYHIDTNAETLVIHLSIRGTLVKSQATAADPKSNRETSDSDISPIVLEGDDTENNSYPNALRNQFFFNDRSAQTFNPVIREGGIATNPPPSCDYNLAATQNIIYDKYMESIEAARLNSPHDENAEPETLLSKPSKPDPVYSEKMKSSVKVMERILNLNSENEVYRDFKFYVDKSDGFKPSGSLLPLWRFANEKTKRKQVTCLQWNPVHPDLFAVSFGSYEFMKQQAGGAVAIYSLKNTKFPELLVATENSTVCCFSWNPEKPALLAVGLYDGTVSVLDVRSRSKKFIYQSTFKNIKHTDPVWEIVWNRMDTDVMSFTSVSVDGRMCLWKLKKSKLECETISTLRMDTSQIETDSIDTSFSLAGHGNGLCFQFSPHEPDTYLVGTEEGLVFQCSRFFRNQPVMTFKAHSMAVYAVKWNAFHRNVFVTSSADWTVKVWSTTNSTPLCSFDLGSAVGDVDWSPVSSSIFVAVNSDGVLYGYDLDINRYKEMTCQRIISKGRLTRVALSRSAPVILVGDDKGVVSCLKLSPNLQKISSNELEKITRIIEILSD